MALLGIGVSVAGAVVGISISVYLYNPAVERVPTLLIDPVRTTIVSSKIFPDSALKVTRADNLPIQGDVTAVRVYFWNAGKQSIKPENILQGLTLTLNDVNGEILDYKILKVSRPDVVKIDLKTSGKNPARDLILEFNILEENDGFTCQIIYAGDPSADVNVLGVVEGGKILCRTFYSTSVLGRHTRPPVIVSLLFIILTDLSRLFITGSRQRAMGASSSFGMQLASFSESFVESNPDSFLLNFTFFAFTGQCVLTAQMLSSRQFSGSHSLLGRSDRARATKRISITVTNRARGKLNKSDVRTAFDWTHSNAIAGCNLARSGSENARTLPKSVGPKQSSKSEPC